jgi:ABC-type antimicrobial peptide transport system permease subunit
MLRLASVKQLDQTVGEMTIGTRLVILALELVTLSTVLLSAAGIYALMAFTITRRRREIGIRSALGAGAPRMLMSILARSAAQVAAGIAVGISIAAVIDHLLDGGWTGRNPVLVLTGVVGLMAVIGLLAALRPAREALRIQPTEALRSD